MSVRGSIYPFYVVGIISKYHAGKVERKSNGNPKWHHDIISLTTKPETLQEAIEFCQTLDPFWVERYIITHCADGKTIVRRYKPQ